MSVRRLRRDDRGASPLASFMVALGFFSLSFATVSLFVAQVGGGASGNGDDVVRNGEAVGVAALLATRPGSPPSWTGAVPLRLGLLKNGAEATLDIAKLDSMRAWTSKPDYDAARAAVGVPSRELFVRTHPIYSSEPGSAVPPGMADYRVAYVADYASLTESAASIAESATLDGLAITYTNAAVDRAGLGLPGDKFPDALTTTTRHLVPRLAGFAGAVDMDTLQTDDSYWKVITLADYSPNYFTSPTSRILTSSNWDAAAGKFRYSAFANNQIFAEDALTVGVFDLRNYGSTTAISLSFSHWADGFKTVPLAPGLNPATDDYGFVSVRCIEACRTGDAIPAVRGGLHVFNGTKNAFQATSIDLSRYYGEKIEVSFVWHSAVSLTAGQGWFIAGPVKLSVTAQGGQPAAIWTNDLDYKTTLYDGLFVGSNVDHSALDDGAATLGVLKTAIRDWIAAGGDLFAFGSDSLSNGWLNPTFTSSGSGQTQGPALLAQSDLSHPILNVPHRVRTGDLEASAKAYRANAGFRSIVLVEEKNGNGATLPLLAVSQPTAQYPGVLVLTSYLPHTLHAEDRSNLIVNFLLYARYNPLYADFGPATGVPYAGAVTSDTRTVLIDASTKGLGTMECALVAYLW